MSARGGVGVGVVLLALALLAGSPGEIRAQGAEAAVAHLERTFEGATLSALHAELDRARERGLPVEPLALKALEGRSKAAPDSLVLRAVAALSERLLRASELLGSEAPTAHLVAAADALYVGVEEADIREMRRAMPGGVMEMGLVVLGDLVQRGVAVDRASRAVLAMGSAGLDGPGFAEFRERVDADIRSGLSPERATAVRVRGVLARIGGGG